MVVWPMFGKVTALAASTGAGLVIYYYKKHRCNENTVYASWTNSCQPINPCALWDRNWDFRDEKSIVKPPKSVQDENRFNTEMEKKRPKTCRHIILVRHGEYLDRGDSDVTHMLTPRGRIQAKYTGKRLKELDINWDKVFASTMTRAQETSDIIVDEIGFDPKKVISCSFLREGAPIPPQPPVGHWKPEASQFYRDGARLEAAFRRYFHRADASDLNDTYTLIVGHGNAIRYFVCRALQFPPEAWLRISINHASITWITIQPNGNVNIKVLGESGHIPAALLTNRIPRDAKDCVDVINRS